MLLIGVRKILGGYLGLLVLCFAQFGLCKVSVVANLLCDVRLL